MNAFTNSSVSPVSSGGRPGAIFSYRNGPGAGTNPGGGGSAGSDSGTGGNVLDDTPGTPPPPPGPGPGTPGTGGGTGSDSGSGGNVLDGTLPLMDATWLLLLLAVVYWFVRKISTRGITETHT